MKSIYKVFALFLPSICLSQTLTIQFSAIRNNTGNMRIAFFNTPEGFDTEKELFVKTVSKASLEKSAWRISFSDVKPGLYGIAVLDDENKNEKMDYGLILPKEGFGFSDYYHTGMKRPKFEAFDFVLKHEVKIVGIKLKYM